MALSVAAKDAIARGLHRYWSERRTPTAFTKTPLRDGVDDSDTYYETNGAAMNTAINATLRSQATTTQKELLHAMVLLARHDPELVRRILGV